MNKVYLFIVYVFGTYTCQQMIHFGLKSKLIQLLRLSKFAYIMWQQSYNTQPIGSLLYVCIADFWNTLSNAIQANL